MIKAIALDDEPLALTVIQSFCNRLDNISLEKTFTKPTDALKYLRQFPVDVIFLDIEMPTHNGIDFYKEISQDTHVIFTTAYSEYAVSAFEVSAVDYLLKPFSFDRFKDAIAKVKTNTVTEPESLLIRADYKLHKINFEDIILIEALDDYIQIHIKNASKVVARMSMKNILEKLPAQQFIRVHRSYIIPIKNIKTIVNKNIQIEEFTVPIGDTYKEEVAALLK